MENTPGSIIKHLRLQKNISQEELAEGIIDRAHLAHIENGRWGLSQETLDALVRRLGYATCDFPNLVLTYVEQKILTMREKLGDCLGIHDYEAATSLISEMETIPEFRDGLHKQFLLKSKAALCLGTEGNISLTRTYLNEAARTISPDFKERSIPGYFLTGEDVEVITMMAELYSLEDLLDKAVALLDMLLQSLDKSAMDAYLKAQCIIIILLNKALYLERQKKYRKALDTCNIAISASQTNRIYGYIPQLMVSKACCLCVINKSNEEEAKYLFRQAYYTKLAFGLNVQADKLKEDILSEYKIDFIV